MQCSRCEWSGEPVFELQLSGKVLPQCPQCSNVVEQPAISEVATQLQEVEKSSPRSRPRLVPTNEKPMDVLSMAKARLEQLEVQLLEMTKLQEEAAVLKRMIAAAGS